MTYENLKICDFGSSQKIDRNKSFDPINFGGFVPATPYYMAPEMLAGTPYTHKADIWACGIIAYILLYGAPPFKGFDDADIKNTIIGNSVNGPPMDDKFWTDPNQVSNECKAFVKQLLTYDQNERPEAKEILLNPWLIAKAKEGAVVVRKDELRAAFENFGRMKDH